MINFDGHPNLKTTLLSEEDQDFHPLLKEEENLKSLEEVSWSAEVPDIAEADEKDASEERADQ